MHAPPEHAPAVSRPLARADDGADLDVPTSLLGSTEPIAPSPALCKVTRAENVIPGSVLFYLQDSNGVVVEERRVMARLATPAYEDDLWRYVRALDRALNGEREPVRAALELLA